VEIRPLALAGLVALGVALGGCGSSTDAGLHGQHPDYETALAGSPPKLAAIHQQANQLLPGGKDAFEQRIAELHGYPAVANVWASWCGPCQFEFPAFQQLSAKYGKQVAFLGINSEDSDGFAEKFLAKAPVPYPSYTDPDKDIANGLGVRGFPSTAFYRRDGELCFLHQGQYRDNSEIGDDVRRYALNEEGCEGA
jgi:cytochrome c biogenesis protein CcmG/thiol:disulfide interchange protein DsbE